MTKSGFISLIGRPNVGKSTLMNQMLGEKVAITSSKPQTTRNRIQGVLTEQECQMIFIDTPGIHKPEHKLGEYMVEAASRAIGDVDLVLFLVEAGRLKQEDLEVLAKLRKQQAEVILVINKVDAVAKDVVLLTIAKLKDLYEFQEIIPVSAKTGENKEILLEQIMKRMPEGPFYFPPDMLTDQPERQLVAELIREKTLYALQKEIPHGIAVVIDTFTEREGRGLIDINATIICEKNSHKPIIIGKGGRTLKEIGSRARQDIERLLGVKVNLQLWVKIKERWRDSDFLIKNFGFDKKEL
ncbi:MAG: GTPase Era [Lachnospiraceae bacterium]|jgi:GTP-binding protein Era|nr:GTPase Era [Lachnospiraceae bacterium]